MNEAFDRYIAGNFLHHNPNFKGDSETFAKVMEQRHQQFPDKAYKVKHVLQDGDLVAMHGRVQIGEKVTALVNIFRFENDKIVELWDIGEEITKDFPNQNGAF